MVHDVRLVALPGDFASWAECFEGETFAQKPTWKQRHSSERLPLAPSPRGLLGRGSGTSLARSSGGKSGALSRRRSDWAPTAMDALGPGPGQAHGATGAHPADPHGEP